MSTTEEALATAQRSLDDLVRHRRERLEKLIARWRRDAAALEACADEVDADEIKTNEEEIEVAECRAIAKQLRECAEELEKVK